VSQIISEVLPVNTTNSVATFSSELGTASGTFQGEPNSGGIRSYNVLISGIISYEISMPEPVQFGSVVVLTIRDSIGNTLHQKTVSYTNTNFFIKSGSIAVHAGEIVEIQGVNSSFNFIIDITVEPSRSISFYESSEYEYPFISQYFSGDGFDVLTPFYFELSMNQSRSFIVNITGTFYYDIVLDGGYNFTSTIDYFSGGAFFQRFSDSDVGGSGSFSVEQGQILTFTVDDGGTPTNGVGFTSFSSYIVPSAPTPTPSPTASPSASPTVSVGRLITITCVKGKLTRIVTSTNPRCPRGYKKK